MERDWPQMRRKDRELTREESREIMRQGEYGILATVDAEGQPYGLPLSYVYQEDKIYFHCALSGLKLDNLKRNPKASFTVVMNTSPVYDKGYSTYYDSAIAFGRVDEVSDPARKSAALYTLTEKYFAGQMGPAEETIKKMLKATGVYEMEIEHLSGKAKKKPA